MGSKWRKAKLALGLNNCLYVPRTQDDSSDTLSDAVLLSSADHHREIPKTPSPSSPSPCSAKHATKPSKKTCAICLTTMKAGEGHAIFTAECSHSFHFHCITSNVKHGNQICPVCRAKWKEIPLQSPKTSLGRGSTNLIVVPQDDPWLTVRQRLLPPRVYPNRHISLFQAPEPNFFDDDDLLDHQDEVTERRDNYTIGTLEVKTYPEVPAVSKSSSHNNFSVLVHLKAPKASGMADQHFRASIDLVTVLDVSGSMAGTKLALLKRAMGFVIQNLGPSDRLSIIAFSSTARRLFPLRRMTDTGRQEALQAVNSLTSNGGTNIAEGLKKGAKVMTDRKRKNSVSSIILLSDGQDTYTVTNPSSDNYSSLLPVSMQFPVHTFGFGADHDAVAMHSISENSGGTFSFIETESVIQDAFAQCIGGLLSVVVQELKVELKCIHPISLNSIKAGSYKTSLASGGKTGFIEVGDMYAEEARDFLVTMDIPVDVSLLFKINYIHKDPITEKIVIKEEASDVKIERPEKITGELAVSVEVDRQINRLRAAEGMAEARAAAERGDLSAAVLVLEKCHKNLVESASAKSGDRLCITLGAELREMQERMANRRVYEESGRAYVLSGLSSHSWQRATARGDSTESTSRVQAYQTPSMVDMVSRSQTLVFGNSSRPFQARPQPR